MIELEPAPPASRNGTEAMRLAVMFGIEVFPCRPHNRAPYTPNGFKDATTDLGQISAWWTAHPDALVAVRPGQDQIVADVDPRNGGDVTLAELEAECGPLPATVTQHTGRGGLHLIFRHPGVELVSKVGGIDIFGRRHYMIVAPSIHPDSGRRYEWRAGHGFGEIEIVELPGSWVERLRKHPKTSTGPRAATLDRPTRLDDRPSPIEWWNEHAGNYTADTVARLGWRPSGRTTGGEGWTRPGKDSGVSAVLYDDGGFYVFSSAAEVSPLQPDTQYDPFELCATVDHAGDKRAAAKTIMEAHPEIWPESHPASFSSPTTVRGDVDTETGEVKADTVTERPALPEEFWTARPELEHIRRAAHSRGRSAPATFFTVLARVAAGMPHVLKLPPIVGGRAGLSFFEGILGPPGAGKSSAADIAAQLVPLGDHVRDRMPIGTGEGFIDVLFAQVDGEGKGKEFRQTFHNAYFWVDEGQAIAAISKRNGSTLLPSIRTVWSDGTLGQSNAAGGRDRRVPAGQYVYGLGVAFQESKLGEFFDDASGGTPQRFAWASATDPSIPGPGRRPGWPGPLDWTPPDIDARRCLDLVDGMYLLDVAGTVRSEIVEADYARVTGRVRVDEFSAHGDLLRLKMAALLAILDRRVNVTVDDWQLAGILKAYSDATGTAALRTIRAEASKAEADTSARLARRKVQEVSAVEQHRTVEAARRIAEKVRAAGAIGVSEARRSLPRWRTEFHDGLDFAVSAGWVVETTEPGQGSPKRVLRAGLSKP